MREDFMIFLTTMKRRNKQCKMKLVILLLCCLGACILTFWKFTNHPKLSEADSVLIGMLTQLPSNNIEPANQSSPIDVSRMNEDIKTDDTTVQETRMPAEKIQLQLVQSVQENNYFCVPACLQMVLRYKGIDKSQTELSKEMNTMPVTGTEYIDIARVANTYLFHNESIGSNDAGYHVQTLNRYDTNPAISSTFDKRVRLDIHTNDPVFVAIDINALYPNLSSANHMIVITGYALYPGTNTIDYYYYIDPYYAIQDDTYGGLKTVTKEQLIKAIIVNEEPAYIW